MDGSYDGKVIKDSFTLSEFVNWLRKSSRDIACVLLSEDAHGKTIAPLDEVRRTVGTRAVTVLLSNSVQNDARDHLGSVNPYRGAARVFPPGDMWFDDPRLVGCVLPSLSSTRFLERIEELLDRRLPTRRKPPTNMIAHTIAAAHPATPATPAKDEPNLFDVHVRERHYRVDIKHAHVCCNAIVSERREYPCVLVSLGVGMTTPYLDVDALVDNIGKAAVIFEIADRAADNWLRDNLPYWARAYNGACRFLAPSNMAGRDHSRELLRMYSTNDSADTVTELTNLVLDVAYPEGYSLGGADDDDAQPQPRHETQRNTKLVEGVVAMMLDGIAYVYVDDERNPRKVRLEVPTALATASLLCEEQPVRGHVDADGQLAIEPEWRTATDALRDYVSGTTVAGRVTFVCEDMFKIMLYPALSGRAGVEVTVRGPELFAGSGIDMNADLRPMLTRGQTIAMRVEERDGDDWLLSLPDAHDTVLPAPSLLPGGPAWLETSAALDYLPRLRSHSTLADVPVEQLLTTVDTVETAQTTIRRMHAQLVELSQDNRQHNDDIGRLREENAKLKRDNHDYEKALEDANPLAVFSGRFASLREELDWMLRAQSLLQFTVEERRRRPLAEWSYGDEFFDSLEKCESKEMTRWPLIHTMLLVLAGKETANGLRPHQLRTGRGGDNPGRKDEQGNAIYRCNVHGQYRLHFTRDVAGRITFMSVNAHDELLL